MCVCAFLDHDYLNLMFSGTFCLFHSQNLIMSFLSFFCRYVKVLCWFLGFFTPLLCLLTFCACSCLSCVLWLGLVPFRSCISWCKFQSASLGGRSVVVHALDMPGKLQTLFLNSSVSSLVFNTVLHSSFSSRWFLDLMPPSFLDQTSSLELFSLSFSFRGFCFLLENSKTHIMYLVVSVYCNVSVYLVDIYSLLFIYCVGFI